MNKFKLAKQMENEYIEDLKTRVPMSLETEVKLRFAFSGGFMAAFDAARNYGYTEAVNAVRESLLLPNTTLSEGPM